jgi:hypothetical protein
LKPRLRFIAIIAFVLAFSASGRISTQDANTPGAAPPAPNLPPRDNYFETLVIEQGQTTGEVTCIFCSVVVRGTVDGDAVAVWGSVDVEGTVRGEVVAVGGSVHLHPDSHVTDDATAVAGRVLRDKGATTDADVTSLWFLFFPGQREFLTPGLLVFVFFHVAVVLLVLLVLRPRRADAIAAALRIRPWRAILAGVLSVSFVVTALSAFNLRGWLDSLVTIGLPLLLLLISVPGFAGICLALGQRIRPRSSPVAAALLGSLLLDAFSAIPLFGLAFATLCFALAVGASLVSRLGFAASVTTGGANATA